MEVIWATTWQKQQSQCAPSKESIQTGHPKLIWVFAGRTLILLVLSCCGSFYFNIFTPKEENENEFAINPNALFKL